MTKARQNRKPPARGRQPEGLPPPPHLPPLGRGRSRATPAWLTSGPSTTLPSHKKFAPIRPLPPSSELHLPHAAPALSPAVTAPSRQRWLRSTKQKPPFNLPPLPTLPTKRPASCRSPSPPPHAALPTPTAVASPHKIRRLSPSPPPNQKPKRPISAPKPKKNPPPSPLRALPPFARHPRVAHPLLVEIRAPWALHKEHRRMRGHRLSWRKLPRRLATRAGEVVVKPPRAQPWMQTTKVYCKGVED